MRPSYLFFTSALLLSACGGERQNDPAVLSDATLATALRQTTDFLVVDSVSDFATASSGFSDTVTAFCSDMTSGGLSDVQTGWKVLADRWYRTSPFLFGPVNDDVVLPDYLYIDSLRQRGNDYTSTVRTDISGMVNGSDVLTSTYFSRKEFTKTGLLALEVAAFETLSRETDAAQILAEYQNKPRKCEVLAGLSSLLQGYASNALSEWTEAYAAGTTPYRDLFLAGETEDGSAALTLLLTRVQEHLDYLKQRSVAVTTAQISADAWPLMSATLDSVEATIMGTDSSTLSFYDLIIAAGETAAAATVVDNIERARTAIAEQNSTDFAAACALLDGNFKRDIPDALAVQLGLNFSDGD